MNQLQDSNGKRRFSRGFYSRIWIVLILTLLLGCSYPLKPTREMEHAVYSVQSGRNELPERFSPLFLVENFGEIYNRIGQPAGRLDEEGNEQIYVDPRRPAVYYMVRHFSTEKAHFTNVIYRIHFPEVPFSIYPFHLTAGRNVGILVIITLDNKERPVLVTTSGTCGCYAAIVPTSWLPADAYPPVWEEGPLEVYGESLPPLLDYRDSSDLRLLVRLRSGVHRIMDLTLVSEQDMLPGISMPFVKASLIHMDSLEKIPINGKTTSFYYKEWPHKGHVKNSFKPWESLLMSLISLDFFVGADKNYGDSQITGNPFYTSLKPWNRSTSDMWDFPGFLKFNGWRL